MAAVKPHMCDICGVSFTKLKELAIHKQCCKDGRTEGSYSCDSCNKRFLYYTDLVQHKKVCVSTEESDSDNAEEENITPTDLREAINKLIHVHKDAGNKKSGESLKYREEMSGEISKYVCTLCQNEFSHISELKDHCKTCREDQPEDEDDSSSDSGASRLKRKCTDYTYNNRRDIEALIRAQSQDKPYSCDACGKCYVRKRNLETHMATHIIKHDSSVDEQQDWNIPAFSPDASPPPPIAVAVKKETPFKCEDCGKHFSLRGNLTKHARLHSEDKPWECSDCNKRFTYQAYLNRHMRIHSGVRPYSCTECDKSFSDQGNLSAHMRCHSTVTPFACHLCGKLFKHQGSLSVHVKSHTGMPK